MKRRLRRVNVPVMIASVFLSVLLWAVVYSQTSVTPGFVAFKLMPRGLDEGRYVVTGLRESLTVRLEGPEQKLDELDNLEPQGLVDLSLAVPGKRQYPIQLWPEWVRDYVPSYPPMVQVQIDELVRRRMPVTPASTGDVQVEGLRVERIRTSNVDPREATIVGPKSWVARVQSVRAELDLADVLAEKASYVVPLQALDSRGAPVDQVRTEPLFVTVTPTLSSTFMDQKTAVFADVEGTPASGLALGSVQVDPPVVLLRGPKSVLTQTNSVRTEPVNAAGIRGDSTFVTRLILPPQTTVVGGQREVRVRVFVRPSGRPRGDLAP